MWSDHIGKLPNVTVQRRKGPSVISDLDEKVLPLHQQAPPIKLEFGLRFVTCVLLIYVIMDGPWIVPPGVLACSLRPCLQPCTGTPMYNVHAWRSSSVCRPVLARLCTCLEQWPGLQTCTGTPAYLPGAVALSADVHAIQLYAVSLVVTVLGLFLILLPPQARKYLTRQEQLNAMFLSI